MNNIKESKKNRILDIALELFFQKGYNNTKIIDIAEGAGVGKGTIYEYFQSKEDLLLNIILCGIDDYFEGYEKIIHSNQPHSEMLFSVLEYEIAHAKKMGPKMMLFSQQFINSKAGIPTSLLDTLQKIWLKKFLYIKEIMTMGVASGKFNNINVNVAALSIMGAAHSFFAIKYGISQCDDVKHFFDTMDFEEKDFFEIVMKGILK